MDKVIALLLGMLLLASVSAAAPAVAADDDNGGDNNDEDNGDGDNGTDTTAAAALTTTGRLITKPAPRFTTGVPVPITTQGQRITKVPAPASRVTGIPAIAGTDAPPARVVSRDNNTLPGFQSSTWEGNVPYVVDSKFESYEKKRIEDAIAALNAQAICVQFRPKQSDDNNYLSFVRDDSKCMSEYIGFADIGEQTVYLSPNCSTARYIYWVLLQALGLPAEHMRPDRDTYISIKWENIDPKYVGNFKKYAFIDDRIAKLEYDFESRLHYGNEKFTVQRGLKTIVAIEDETRDLGNPLSPTFLDYKKVASLYCRDGVINPGPLVEQPGVEVPDAPDTPDTPGVTRQPRANAPAAVIAGLRSLLDTVTVAPNMTNVCKCLPKPNASGSCDGQGGFQWQGMWQQCQASSAATVCQCENILLNPCWCEAATDPSCKTSTCPLTTCVKKCRSKN